MVCSWDINGIFMGYAWAINGIVVGYSWDIHEYNESHHDSWLNHHDIPFTSHRK
jgi:hypothetical protein